MQLLMLMTAVISLLTAVVSLTANLLAARSWIQQLWQQLRARRVRRATARLRAGRRPTRRLWRRSQ